LALLDLLVLRVVRDHRELRETLALLDQQVHKVTKETRAIRAAMVHKDQKAIRESRDPREIPVLKEQLAQLDLPGLLVRRAIREI
jgi:hypothetical protein